MSGQKGDDGPTFPRGAGALEAVQHDQDDAPIFGGAVERLPLMSRSRPRLESPTSVWPSALELPLNCP